MGTTAHTLFWSTLLYDKGTYEHDVAIKHKNKKSTVTLNKHVVCVPVYSSQRWSLKRPCWARLWPCRPVKTCCNTGKAATMSAAQGDRASALLLIGRCRICCIRNNATISRIVSLLNSADTFTPYLTFVFWMFALYCSHLHWWMCFAARQMTAAVYRWLREQRSALEAGNPPSISPCLISRTPLLVCSPAS